MFQASSLDCQHESIHVLCSCPFSRSLSNAIKDSESIQANCQSLIEGDPLEALAQEEDIISEVNYNSNRENLSSTEQTETILVPTVYLNYTER